MGKVRLRKQVGVHTKEANIIIVRSTHKNYLEKGDRTIETLRNELMKESKKTKQVIELSKTALKNLKPYEEGTIVVRPRGKIVQYYIKEPGEKNGTYIPKSYTARAIDTVKYEYYNKIIINSTKRLKAVDKLLSIIDDTTPLSIYNNMAKGKQMILPQLEESDEDFIKRWEAIEYDGKTFGVNKIEIYTEKGEQVRSKSEKIIADKLYANGIPYKYEYPIYLNGMGIVYPDFTILDIKNRREVILEHLGMMDDQEYADKAVGKIQIYSRNGWVLGDNLIVTMETANKPFDSRVLDGIIDVISG